jgi:hypothetical protein
MRGIVASAEGIPVAVKVGLKPGGEIQEVPSHLGQQIGLAISAPQEEQHAAV